MFGFSDRISESRCSNSSLCVIVCVSFDYTIGEHMYDNKDGKNEHRKTPIRELADACILL